MIASSFAREILAWSSRAIRGFFFLGIAVAFLFFTKLLRSHWSFMVFVPGKR
jgi:hypothetical protein